MTLYSKAQIGMKRLWKNCVCEIMHFVILDVKIPAGNEPASEKWSRYLLDQITEGSLCFPMHVFGLTAHKEIADIEREYYELNLFGFFVFDWESETWAIDGIKN